MKSSLSDSTLIAHDSSTHTSSHWTFVFLLASDVSDQITNELESRCNISSFVQQGASVSGAAAVYCVVLGSVLFLCSHSRLLTSRSDLGAGNQTGLDLVEVNKHSGRSPPSKLHNMLR